MGETYGIADLAKEFGVTTRTVRFYEDKGLIAPAREGQRRIYSPRDRVRLRLIMRGKRLGLTLDEIAELMDLYDVDPSEVTQLKQFIDVIRDRKTVLEGQKKDIEETLAEMTRLERQCTQLLSQKQTKK
ncbi:MAG: MerR family DNA-binding transcriptional regulator [Rhodospirillales bacterium]|nr:MerR family DNA-binding transcriptional regulator [Rhodospirillales bacterium]MBO6786449.1 MerR family DNA-binding transcriptional regulator [Rhodospirillales bacterium]